jgi:hypothetical protein
MIEAVLRSHIFNLVVFSVLVSAVFATLLRADTKSRLRFGIYAFSAFVLATVVLGWVMRPFPS